MRTTLAILLIAATATLRAQSGTSDHGLFVHPNPSSGEVTITWEGSPDDGPFTLELFTADGRLADRTAWVDVRRPARIEQLPAGNYVVRTTDRFWRTEQVNLIVNHTGK